MVAGKSEECPVRWGLERDPRILILRWRDGYGALVRGVLGPDRKHSLLVRHFPAGLFQDLAWRLVKLLGRVTLVKL